MGMEHYGHGTITESPITLKVQTSTLWLNIFVCCLALIKNGKILKKKKIEIYNLTFHNIPLN